MPAVSSARRYTTWTYSLKRAAIHPVECDANARASHPAWRRSTVAVIQGLEVSSFTIRTVSIRAGNGGELSASIHPNANGVSIIG